MGCGYSLFPSQLLRGRVSVGTPLPRHSPGRAEGCEGAPWFSYSSRSVLLDEVLSGTESNPSGIRCGVGKLRPGALVWLGN